MSIFHDVGKELHRVLGSAIGESFMKHQAILAAVAQGDPLELVLDRILAAIEDESPGIIGSVLLLERDHQSMRCAASRGLPEAYCNAINGLKIGPRTGSCGTAIYFGEPVMVSDISTDPLWDGYRELALKYGLRACWSYPLMCGGDKEHRAMGAFAVYSREPGMPDERVTELMRRYRHIACIAIESSLNLTELEESRLRLAEAQRIAKLGSWVWDPLSDNVTWSDSIYDLFGLKKGEVRPGLDAFLQLVHPEDRKHVESRVAAIEAGGSEFNNDIRLIRPGGDMIWIHSVGRVTRDAKGCVIRVEGTDQDITERKRTEQDLRLFRSLIDCSSDFVEVIDLQTGRFRDVNQRACEAHGYTREEFLQMTVYEINPDLSPEIYEHNLRIMREQRRICFEGRHRRKDGSYFPVEITLNFAAPEQNLLLGIVRDITERRQLEERVRQSQKLEAIGRLAGGIAHDFNNLLTVINGDSGWLLKSAPEGSQHREALEAIHDAGERAAVLTQQLLAFSRKSVSRPTQVDLNELLRRDARIISRLLGPDIQLELKLDMPLGLIEADAGHAEQVLLNLVANARDAMPAGGRLTIETQRRREPDKSLKDRPIARFTEQVCLRVSDTGSGISEDLLPHIFEPFFTTKDVGRGTGLGLAVVHGIVEQCGGQIDVSSRSGSGTTFQVTFPAMPPSLKVVSIHDSVTPNHKRESATTDIAETILLVDDEPAVRRLLKTVLESKGLQVVTAADGKEALAVLRNKERRIDLLITDMTMPGMTGNELVEQAKLAVPDLRVLFVSGYTAISPDQLADDAGRTAFLCKPFSAEVLCSTVRNLMTAGSTDPSTSRT